MAARQKTLAIVYDWIPYPVRSGDNKRVGEMIEVLRRNGWQVHLVLTSPISKKSRALCLQHVDAVHAFWGRNLLKIVTRFTIRKTNGLLHACGLPGLSDLVSRALGRNRRLAVDLVSRLPTYPPGLAEFLGRLHARHQWDAIIVNFLWLHPCIRELRGRIPCILDTIDLQHDRAQQFAAAGLHQPVAMNRDEEAGILKTFDAVIAIQHKEATELRSMCPDTPVLVVGTSAMPTAPAQDRPEPGRILYVGGANPANIDGLRRFLEKSWPLLRQECPSARLRVCGYVYQAFLADSYPAVEFIGHVEDIEAEYAAAALLITPLWIGTGLKIKTVEALARAKPLVTTPKGIEGMEGDVASACLLARDETAFATAAASILRDRALRARLTASAAEYRDQFLTPAHVYRELLEFLEAENHTSPRRESRRPGSQRIG